MAVKQVVASPMGNLLLEEVDGALIRCCLTDSKVTDTNASPFLGAVKQQLSEYFAGDRHDFELSLKPVGTAFQQQVWQELQKIPYGDTISYQQLAQRIGNPKAVRAVGTANGRNPVCIMIPCHRVIRANGDLGGYAGGLDNKRLLLNLEQKM